MTDIVDSDGKSEEIEECNYPDSSPSSDDSEYYSLPVFPDLTLSEEESSEEEMDVERLRSSDQVAEFREALQRICKPSQVEVLQSKYNHLEPVLQRGPQCAFACLSMLAKRVGLNHTPDFLMSEGKARGFTNRGEMFSTLNVANLAAELFGEFYNVNHVQKDSLTNEKDQIKEYLERGDFVMVAYDSDYNHYPTNLAGIKSHWAVLCGYAHCDTDDLFVVARHGKSRHAGLWKFKDLIRSNAQLRTIDPRRLTRSNVFVIPAGGVSAGLANQYIIFEEISGEKVDNDSKGN